MKKSYLYILVVIIIVAGISFYLSQSNQAKENPDQATETKPKAAAEIFNLDQNSANSLDFPPTTEETPESEKVQYYYPISQYNERISIRSFAKSVQAGDEKSLDCGSVFTGFHTADDLEVFPDELNLEVRVFAIARGLVKKVETVDGYGGLIVISHDLNGQKVTAYYGHIDLKAAAVSPDQEVKAGDPLANLGDHCSSETAKERKHLHFGLHKGEEIDFRGYVSNQTELSQWLNPKIILEDLKAKEPKSE